MESKIRVISLVDLALMSQEADVRIVKVVEWLIEMNFLPDVFVNVRYVTVKGLTEKP